MMDGAAAPAAGEDHSEHTPGQGAAPQGNADAAPAAAASEQRTATVGAIEVKVAPVNLFDPSGETLDFSVDLEAQGQPLDLDLAAMANLVIDGEETSATGWKVNFDHGHHINGTLSFPLADVAGTLTKGATVMIHIDKPDGEGHAMFNWELPD
jgi:hypothetical protein